MKFKECNDCRYKDRRKDMYPCIDCKDGDKPLTCYDCRIYWNRYKPCKKGIRTCKNFEWD